ANKYQFIIVKPAGGQPSYRGMGLVRLLALERISSAVFRSLLPAYPPPVPLHFSFLLQPYNISADCGRRTFQKLHHLLDRHAFMEMRSRQYFFFSFRIFHENTSFLLFLLLYQVYALITIKI